MNKKAIFNAATKLRPTGNKINQRNSKLRMLKCTFSEREKKESASACKTAQPQIINHTAAFKKLRDFYSACRAREMS